MLPFEDPALGEPRPGVACVHCGEEFGHWEFPHQGGGVFCFGLVSFHVRVKAGSLKPLVLL